MTGVSENVTASSEDFPEDVRPTLLKMSEDVPMTLMNADCRRLKGPYLGDLIEFLLLIMC